jgi:hypothetical protein
MAEEVVQGEAKPDEVHPFSVLFTRPREFIEEMQLDGDLVRGQIARVCVGWRHVGPAGSFIQFHLFANAIVRGVLVKLDHRVGQTMHYDDENMRKTVDQQADIVRDALKKLGMDVRGGTFQEASSS